MVLSSPETQNIHIAKELQFTILTFGCLGFSLAILLIPFLDYVSAPFWLFILIGTIVPAFLFVALLWIFNHAKWPDSISSNEIYSLARFVIMGGTSAGIAFGVLNKK